MIIVGRVARSDRDSSGLRQGRQTGRAWDACECPPMPMILAAFQSTRAELNTVEACGTGSRKRMRTGGEALEAQDGCAHVGCQRRRRGKRSYDGSHGGRQRCARVTRRAHMLQCAARTVRAGEGGALVQDPSWGGARKLQRGAGPMASPLRRTPHFRGRISIPVLCLVQLHSCVLHAPRSRTLPRISPTPSQLWQLKRLQRAFRHGTALWARLSCTSAPHRKCVLSRTYTCAAPWARPDGASPLLRAHC